MTNALGAARKTPALCLSLAFALLACAGFFTATAAATTPGGVTTTTPETEEAPESTETTETVGPPGKATLVRGRAIPPANAPAAVKKVIAAANKIRTKPYIYGGGHGRWWDAGYDCSGAVSFALHGGNLITSPMPSGPMEAWGLPGKGRWITVYANAGHAYAVIAGLRWDTAGVTNGTGPRWHKSLAAAASGPFVARHPVGY
jgi:cell wall-associated NlpC family hydrolase